MSLINPILGKLEDAVRYETSKSNISAYNISRIDDKNFYRVSFSEVLAEQRQKLGLPEQDPDDYMGKEVNFETETALIGKSKLKHSSYLRLLGMHYGILRKVFSQGKG